MTLRECSEERFGLDDLMREMWRRHGLTGQGVGEGDIERLAETLVGANLNEFFKLAVYGTSDLPLEAWFTSLGIGYRLRPAADQDDQGGYLKIVEPRKPTVEPGWRFRPQGEMLQLTQVVNGGAAQRAGLAAGDYLVAVDGLKVERDSLQRMVNDWSSERTVTVHAFRRDELMTFALRPRLASDDTCDLWLLPDEELSVEQIRRRQAWKRSSVSADRGARTPSS
jgi:predicted metalloprotease with PDZ domain